MTAVHRRSGKRGTLPISRGVALSAKLDSARGFFQDSLFQLFLTLDAVSGPGHGFQALAVDLFAAGDAFPETTFANARQGSIHHHQKLAIVIALAEEELLCVRTGGAVGDVLGSVLVGGAAISLIASHSAAQFLLSGLQAFLE